LKQTYLVREQVFLHNYPKSKVQIGLLFEITSFEVLINFGEDHTLKRLKKIHSLL